VTPSRYHKNKRTEKKNARSCEKWKIIVGWDGHRLHYENWHRCLQLGIRVWREINKQTAKIFNSYDCNSEIRVIDLRGGRAQTLKQYPSVSIHDWTMENTRQFVALQTRKFQPNDNFVTLMFEKCWIIQGILEPSSLPPIHPDWSQQFLKYQCNLL
jgi:hypothetical protein